MPRKTPHHNQLSLLTAAEERAQADALFSSIGDGAIATDEFGRITRINPTALQILGYTRDELLGTWFPKSIISINNDGTPTNLIDRAITKAYLYGKSITEKVNYRTKHGRVIPVTATVSPIILDGKPVGAIEVFRDITLEYEIDRMKSEFISLASHQLRTPLSAIKTYSHMLVDGYMGEVNPKQRRSLRTIIMASDRMNELISTLLNISRIESGTIAVTPKQLNLNRTLEGVIGELQLLAAEKNITLSFAAPKRPLLVKTDSLITREILTNLLTNAIKYTPVGGTVRATLQNRSYDGLFAITDSGIGIPAAAHDQIFTKFFRAENVVKQETSGTGLGLYLVKGLVHALNGKVWFKSQENAGTTFYFSLPKTKISKTSKRRAITSEATTDESH